MTAQTSSLVCERSCHMLATPVLTIRRAVGLCQYFLIVDQNICTRFMLPHTSLVGLTACWDLRSRLSTTLLVVACYPHNVCVHRIFFSKVQCKQSRVLTRSHLCACMLASMRGVGLGSRTSYLAMSYRIRRLSKDLEKQIAGHAWSCKAYRKQSNAALLIDFES